MSLFLSSLPIWLSALVVVVTPTVLAMLGSLLVRRTWGLERLVTNNEVAGFKFAVVGVTYAVLLGFAVIVVWEKFRDAEMAVGAEASAVVAMHRLSFGLSGTTGDEVRSRVKDYVNVAIADDWPAMARGKAGILASKALDALYASVTSAEVNTPRERLIFSEILTRLDAITAARRERLLLATGIVPSVLWPALLGGALATLGFTFFFGSQSARAQVLMTGMLAVVIFMALFVVVAVDHPFTGPVSVGTEILRAATETMARGG